MGLKLVSPKEHAAKIIFTIQLSEGQSSKTVGDALALQGYIVHYESAYLQKNNWIQIACLNHYKERDMKRMLNCLQMCLFQSGVHIHAHQLKRTNKMKFPSKGLQTVQQIDS